MANDVPKALLAIYHIKQYSFMKFLLQSWKKQTDSFEKSFLFKNTFSWLKCVNPFEKILPFELASFIFRNNFTQSKWTPFSFNSRTLAKVHDCIMKSVQVVPNWESTKTRLCTKFPFFKKSWWMLRVLPQLCLLDSFLPYLRAFQWGNVCPCT